MRILFIHHNSDTYGSSRSLVRLLQTLDKQFLPVVVLAEDGPLREMIEQLGVKVVLQPTLSVITRPVLASWRIIPFLLNIPRSALHLRKTIKDYGIDAVHTNTGIIVTGGLAAKLAGVAHVWHIRDWFQEFKAFWHLYSRYILWSSDRVIAVSQAIADQFPNSSKIIVINNGFALEEFNVPKNDLRSDFRKCYNISPDEFVVACVGRIKLIRKGQEVLINAAHLLVKRRLKAKFLIVGAPYRGNEHHLRALNDLVHELGLVEQVIFTGEMADTRPAYAAADVFVLPSAQPEPFGGVVMEAMAMGLPVIATNIGGSVEQVSEGETGFLVPPGDANILADRIEFLINRPDVRKCFSEAAPIRIKEKFALKDMARRIENVYVDIGRNAR